MFKYLHHNIDKDDHEGVDEADEQPDLHRLDAGGVGEGGGHREVHRGQHHHAGDVHCDYQVLDRKRSVGIKGNLSLQSAAVT